MADIDYSIKDVENVVKTDGIVKSTSITRFTAPGENYISLVVRADFEIEKDGTTETFSTIAKRLPLGERKEIGFYGKAMDKEITWYTEIQNILIDFAKEHQIEEVLDFFPKYYGSRYSLDTTKNKSDRDALLLIENLIPQGFGIEDRYKGFDFITSKEILKSLATFHALPLAMKLKKPELFKNLKSILDSHGPMGPPKEKDGEEKDGKEKDGEKKKMGPPPTAGIVIDAIIDMPECQPYVEKLRALKENTKSIGHPMFRPAPEPWNTILHNDFWVNNIMVSCGEGRKPLVKIVDFQTYDYGSYAKDLVFFLLTSVHNDVFKDQLDDLLRCYYDQLTSILKRADVDLTLSYDEYVKELERVARETELDHAIFFSIIIFGEKGTGLDPSTQDFDPVKHMTDSVKNINQYHKDKLATITIGAAKRNWL